MRKAISSCGILLLLASVALAQGSASFLQKTFSCDDATGILCAEVYQSIGYHGAYTGHDEPSVLFYSAVAGSGNTMVYLMQLPKDPPTLPKQDGTGGTFNFQLHPAFWFGMAMCDDQSAPNPGGSSVGPNVLCTPDSDLNIFDSTDSTAADYMGKHPGTGTWLAAMDSARKHDFAFNEAISLLIPCENQQEIDYYWDKLSADPKAEQCGWLKDKFGLSWQVWPTAMGEMMTRGTPEQIARVTKAFLPMKKFDIQRLREAFEGRAA
jgi:hypothetical protein